MLTHLQQLGESVKASPIVKKLGPLLDRGQGVSYDEPDVLHLNYVRPGSDSRLNTDGLLWVLDELPSVKHLWIEGQNGGDPLQDGSIIEMVTVAKKRRPNLQIQLRSPGYALLGKSLSQQKALLEPLLKTVHRLTWTLPGHKPAIYARQGNRPAPEILPLSEALHQAVTIKKHLHKTGGRLALLDMCLSLDPVMGDQLPEMIRWAEQVGVDALCFSLYQTAAEQAQGVVASLHLLPLHLNEEQFRLPVALPQAPSESAINEEPPCLDPFQLVSINPLDLQVAGCRQQLADFAGGPVACQGDFWNTQQAQALRKSLSQQAGNSLPAPCASCTKRQRVITPSQQTVLNREWLPPGWSSVYSGANW